MVTQDQLRERIGRRPFVPFRIMLSSGETVDVTRTLQAVAMPSRVVVGTNDDRFRWIWLRDIERVDEVEVTRAS